MSRYLSLRDLPPRQPGECRWCRTRVTGRRKTWCSDACVREYQIRNSGGTARHAVEQRDRGVCALCGLDTRALEDMVRLALRTWARWRRRHGLPRENRDGLYMVLPRHGRKWIDLSRTLWEADHILAVSEGGGGCGLDNLRTLDRWCHARETGMLRRRLNRQAKACAILDAAEKPLVEMDHV